MVKIPPPLSPCYPSRGPLNPGTIPVDNTEIYEIVGAHQETAIGDDGLESEFEGGGQESPWGSPRSLLP